MLDTDFTRLVGCEVPIQLAGMGSILSPELAAAVSEAGALGQLTFAGVPLDVAEQRMDAVRSRTSRPFGVNLLIPAIDPAVLEMAAKRARVVDFFWGDPDARLVKKAHEGGAMASWQVGSVEEARAAEAAGCDFIIAQGTEAGGHIRGHLGLLPLLCEVLDAVSIPVLGAGGIGSPRALAAVLAAGGAGVRMGTRFIAAVESNAHPTYVAAVIAARSEDSVHTSQFHVRCALCPSTHGMLRSAIEAAAAIDQDVVGEVALYGDRMPIPHYAGLPPMKQVTGEVAAMACYAGQSVGAVKRAQPAAEIIAEMASGAEALLTRRASAVGGQAPSRAEGSNPRLY